MQHLFSFYTCTYIVFVTRARYYQLCLPRIIVRRWRTGTIVPQRLMTSICLEKLKTRWDCYAQKIVWLIQMSDSSFRNSVYNSTRHFVNLNRETISITIQAADFLDRSYPSSGSSGRSISLHVYLSLIPGVTHPRLHGPMIASCKLAVRSDRITSNCM